MPPLTLLVIPSGRGFTAMCSVHGPVGTASPAGLASLLCLGHIAAHHQPATQPQETP